MANSNDEAMSIFSLVDGLSSANSQFSLQKKKCRKDFLEFMEANGYFGINKMGSPAPDCLDDDEGLRIILRQSDAERIRPNVELWLRSYGAGSDEKLRLLTERLKTLFPETGALFGDFMDYAQTDSNVAWKLADYLCFALDSEICEMTSEDLDILAAGMDRDLPLSSAAMFSGFLMYGRECGRLSNGWAYSFNSRRMTEPDGAYSTPDFLKMAYVVFNDESWMDNGLLEKALRSGRDANLWLFVACHFICGWRGTDIVRLPMPALRESGESIRSMIAEGHFDTGGFINELELRLRYAPVTPQKTEMYADVPDLKLFVPESFRYPFGIILAIAVSHCGSVKPGGEFLRKAGDRPHVMSFFGEGFVKACGGRGFSSRRANKSYLQGIEMVADTSDSRPKGYMLAALARSHKGGYGTLPETTDIYLRDVKFAGYRPEFIAREMFERGVFGFIPALMMEMYAEGGYTDLPIPAQTKALAVIGIEAAGLEGIAKSVDYSLASARNAISEVMKRPEDIRGSIADILQNIASGNAPGKQEGFLCLMTASGSVCPDADRACCIGCGYEIYTKTMLHCLSKEYARLRAAKNGEDAPEAERSAKILKEAVMPAIDEIISSIKLLYPGADVKAMLNIMKTGAMLC